MDYFDRNKEHEAGIFNLEIDTTAQATFLEMARWTKFLAILGFIGMGLIILACVVMGVFLANTPIPQFNGISTTFFATIYLIFAAIYIYPIYALYKYSVLIKKAIKTANKEQFNSAIGFLKGMFKYIGIIMIILISIYGFVLIIAGGAMALRHS